MGQAITPVLDTDIEKVKEQLAMAAALRKQGMEGTGGAGYHGGRVFAVGNQLGNIAQMIGGQLLGNQAREQQAGIEQRQKQERQDFLNQMPQAYAEMELQPATDEQAFGPTQSPLQQTMARVDPRKYAQQLREWGSKAMLIPGMEGIGAQSVQQAMLAPEKEADRAATLQARQYEILTRAQEAAKLQRERLDEQSRRDRERAEDGANQIRLTASLAAGNRNSNADLQRSILEQRLEDMQRKAKEGTTAQQKEAIAAASRKRTLDEAMTNIDILLGEGNYKAGGGVLPKSTGSGAGRMVDVAAGFFGHGTEGAKNAAKIGPLANPILMQVPRFEGPQSDADTRVYKEAAGQLADSTLPVSVRISAARTVKDIMVRRKGQFGVQGDDAPASSAVSDEDLLKKYR